MPFPTHKIRSHISNVVYIIPILSVSSPRTHNNNGIRTPKTLNPTNKKEK